MESSMRMACVRAYWRMARRWLRTSCCSLLAIVVHVAGDLPVPSSAHTTNSASRRPPRREQGHPYSASGGRRICRGIAWRYMASKDPDFETKAADIM